MEFNIEALNEEIKRDPLVRSREAFDFFDRERRSILAENLRDVQAYVVQN